jgi:hypothetical protein
MEYSHHLPQTPISPYEIHFSSLGPFGLWKWIFLKKISNPNLISDYEKKIQHHKLTKLHTFIQILHEI